MYNKILYYFLQFKGLIILTMISLLIVTLIVTILMKDFAWNRRTHLLMMTLFFQMPTQYMVYLAANYIQLMFVLSALLFSVSMELSHLVLLVLLGLLQAFSIGQLGEGIRSFVGSVLLYVAFLIIDLLKTYIFDMHFDFRIAVVCGMMYVFLILYAFYFFINSIKCLASRDERIAKRVGFLWNRPRRVKEQDTLEVVDLDEEEETIKP
jgi:hypothetical protein